jgi:DNA-binding NarL/FixJ family response regulator
LYFSHSIYISMSILIGTFDEHRLVMEGICALLANSENTEVVLQCNDKNKLLEALKSMPINVLIINIHVLNTPILNLIAQLSISFPKTRILIMAVADSEDIILKTIKAGAKGYLSKDADRNELVEAIYTLRNGFDYYSKSITHLLVNKYITRIKNEDKILKPNVENLSMRQVEILKLWGENYSNKAIADKLFISLRTVETHKNHIMQKLNLKTTVDMVKFAIRNNLIEI